MEGAPPTFLLSAHPHRLLVIPAGPQPGSRGVACLRCRSGGMEPASRSVLQRVAAPLRVMIVDDDADWRRLLRECLEDLGYEAFEAASGEEALDLLERTRPDVVLLDLNMPGMRGEQVVERLPRDPPKIVFLTGLPTREVGPALGKGAHYYLPKGASREQLDLLLQSLAP